MNKKAWIDTRDSFWFVPAVYSILAFLLVLGLNYVDAWLISGFKDHIPKILITSKGVAKELYSALVTAILTMTTISFSVIMVVLTTYSTQFSPRTLQDFMRSKVTHHVLGIYCFGFIFALIHLLLVDKNDTIIGPIIMAVIAIICLGSFVYFIHHSARWIQVNNLIAKIQRDNSKVIAHAFDASEIGEYENWEKDDINQIQKRSKQEFQARKTGYVQTIDWVSLVRWAKEQDYVVDVHVQIGDFVLENLPLASIFKNDGVEGESRLAQFIVVGSERTDLKDVEFLIQKLVEIAVKAISPAVNDPHTAINSINRIGVMLGDLAKTYKEISYMTDEKGSLRIIKQPKRFEEFLYTAFYQIKYYGKGDVSIYYSLIDVLYKISMVSDETIQQKVWNFHYYIVDEIEWDDLHELDREHLMSIYEKFCECCKV